MPLISIIIPVYNTGKYLKQCLDSILCQSFKKFEIICVNDGSKDNSLEILNSYKEKDNRIVVISKENEGQGIARNKGLELARGKYIIFADSDDWFEQGALQKLYDKMEKDDSDVVFFCVNTYRQKTGSKTQYPYALKYIRGFDDKVFSPTDVKDCLFYIPAFPFKIYKKSFLDKIGYHYGKNKFWEDHLPHFSALSQSSRMSILNDYIYNYRLHEASATANAAKYADIIFENFLECEKELRNFDNWQVFKAYFAARKIKVALNYYEKFTAQDKKIWYKNMRKLFCYIKKNYINDLKIIEFDLRIFNKICTMPYNLYCFYANAVKTYKVILMYLRFN